MINAFTRCINARNVNDAYEYALRGLPYASGAESSRVGNVIVSDTPVVTCYERPMERVLFSPLRDANPFFHFNEALWMLAGRDDVAYPVLFNSNFGQFSDDGERFWGAYGFRWRKWFGYDQLDIVINELKQSPDSRRCVIAMWSPSYVVYPDSETTVAMVQPDLMQALASGKDVPCNTHIYLRVVRGQLDMMVNARSNDVFWGAYGANVVHFSFLHEYLARSIGVSVGRLWQNSFNYHAYTDRFAEERFKEYADDARATDFYKDETVTALPIMTVSREVWDEELLMFLTWSEWLMTDPSMEHAGFEEEFFSDVADPLVRAWERHKAKDYPAALSYAQTIAAQDWRKACLMWLERRQRNYEAKKGTENV